MRKVRKEGEVMRKVVLKNVLYALLCACALSSDSFDAPDPALVSARVEYNVVSMLRDDGTKSELSVVLSYQRHSGVSHGGSERGGSGSE